MTKNYKIKKVSSVNKDIINQEQLIDGINNIKVINSWKKIGYKGTKLEANWNKIY